MHSAEPGGIKALYRQLLPARRRQLWIVGLLMPTAALAEMLMVAAIVPFIAALDPGTNQQGPLAGVLGWIDRAMPTSAIVTATSLFIAIAILAALLRLSLSWWSLRFSSALGHEFNTDIQRRMLHQPYLFHVSSHSSRLIASLEKVDELVLNFVLRGLQLASALIIAMGVIVALLWVDLLGAIAALLFVASLYGAALLLVRPRYQQNADLLATAHQQRIQVVQENLGGIRDIILERSQEAHLATFRAVDEPFVRARMETVFYSAAPRYLVEGLGFGVIALVALFIVDRPGGLAAALPVLGALALGALRLLPLAGQIYGSWVNLVSARPMVREVLSLLNLPIQSDNQQPAGLAFTKSLTLEGVSLHYPGRAQPAVHDISLTIAKGARVAIVGKTGSGKSTLADLLMGLIEPIEGQIRVDQTLLAGAALGAWRRSVAHVPQAIFLADTSIARNIALGAADNQLDMARITRAAEAAQLHSFVASLPDGYDTRVGEQGVKLSGGQRQRLALARAIYKQAPFLVLDEATSALDEETEAAVLSALDGLHKQRCTIIIIAHRLSTVKRCDRIFVLDEGQLVQSGSFTELFGRLNRLQEQGELYG